MQYLLIVSTKEGSKLYFGPFNSTREARQYAEGRFSHLRRDQWEIAVLNEVSPVRLVASA